MGKSTKRRGRKRGNKTGNNNKSGGNTDTNTNTNTNPGNPNSSGSSPLIIKIRHANSVIRHGALSALSCTLFSPESLSSSSTSSSTSSSKRPATTIKMELIQAVAERIMDDDMPCALCAVGCIANYILFANTNSNINDKSNDNEQNRVNRVETILTPVLLAKMNTACDQIGSIHKQMVALASTLSKEGDSLATSISLKAAEEAVAAQNQSHKKKKKSQNKKNTSPSTSSSVKMEQMARMIMEQFTLLSLSLHAFCGMVENFSVNNTSSSLLYHQRDQFLSTTMRSLIISKEMIQSLSDATCITSTKDSNNSNNDSDSGNNNNNKDQSAGTDDGPVAIVNKFIAKKENDENIISDVATYAARTIHSSSDDNPEFVEALLSPPPTSSLTSTNTWDVIISSISNTTLPTLSRLHCAGTVITSRHCILDLASSTNATGEAGAKFQKIQTEIDSTIANQIFPLLLQCTTYSTDIASALCQQISTVENMLKEEREDEEIEKNVIQMVDKKKESARLIAKRQKKMKKAAAAAAATAAAAEKEVSGEKDDTMAEGKDDKESATANNGDDDEMKNEITVSKEETEEKYDKAITAWKNACMPLKLSIEVIANLCAKRMDEDQNEDFGDMDSEMGWDMEKEEQLLSSCATTPNFTKKLDEDDLFLNAIISCGIPDRVLSVFGCILLSLIGVKKDQIPEVAIEDLLDILTKCGVCLGNTVCNLEQWKSSETELAAVWKEIFQCLTAAMNGEVAFANAVLPCQAISALFTTMVAFLRFRPSLVKNVNQQDLELILSYVILEVPLDLTNKGGASAEHQYSDVVSDIQKDAIGLIGILCSEPHSDEINQRICSVFLTVLNRDQSSSASLISELMNALMDMYSADEGDPGNHEIVFRKNNVLGMFEKIVPILKRKIREETNPDPMDVAFWNETTLNATRFISYKRG